MINYHIIVHLIITSFSVTLIITLKPEYFLVMQIQDHVLGNVHVASPILTIKTQNDMCKIEAV